MVESAGRIYPDPCAAGKKGRTPSTARDSLRFDSFRLESSASGCDAIGARVHSARATGWRLTVGGIDLRGKRER